jgi:hypothetical protein
MGTPETGPASQFGMRAFSSENGPYYTLNRAFENCFQAGSWRPEGWTPASMIQRGINGLLSITTGFQFFLNAPGMQGSYELVQARIQRVIELTEETYV